MDDSLPVRGFERLGDLHGDGQCFIERYRAPRDTLGQILALDQFHHERGRGAGSLQSIDGGDVRMIQRRQDLGFALEAGQPFGVAGHLGRENLQRDLAFEVGIGRPVNLAHPAGAQQAGDFVGSDQRAG